MNQFKTTLVAIMALLLGTAQGAEAQNWSKQKIYAFGFAASFSDSTVYFTDIQELDDAYIRKKNHFLYHREDYSNQLKYYLADKNQKNRSCIISYALKRKDAEKKLLKMRKRYSKENHYDVRYIRPDEFSFNGVKPSDEELNEKSLTKAEKKALKKENKAKKKQNKKKGPKNGMPPAPKGANGKPPVPRK
ncbi:MAG: hypothetical protein J5506_09550 [Prevotella sp.]|nr:hypothetical protein [Prevotella sp.]